MLGAFPPLWVSWGNPPHTCPYANATNTVSHWDSLPRRFYLYQSDTKLATKLPWLFHTLIFLNMFMKTPISKQLTRKIFAHHFYQTKNKKWCFSCPHSKQIRGLWWILWPMHWQHYVEKQVSIFWLIKSNNHHRLGQDLWPWKSNREDVCFRLYFLETFLLV